MEAELEQPKAIMEADVEATLAAGFAQHLIKPVTFDQLQTAIEQVVTGAEAKHKEQSQQSSSVSSNR